MLFTKYWNMSDEELLHVAFTDEGCSELAHELAMRLERLIDESDLPDAPKWAQDLVNGDDA